MKRPRYLPDNFTLVLVLTVTLSSIFPCQGKAAELFDWVTNLAIALLFFMHGAKLARQSIIMGLLHWRLHLLIFCLTFVIFPLLGICLKPILSPLITPTLYIGILYLCTLPATVQSAIAFTSLARGNVPAAICSASGSSLLGIFITPLLVGIIINTSGSLESASTLQAMEKIMLQLLLPFIAGQLMRPLIGNFVDNHRGILRNVDQSSILLVVYTAFSSAVIEGLWSKTPLPAIIGLILVCCILLAIVLFCSTILSRFFNFNKEDEITIVFCGSKKSLASGVPMAQVLFAGSTMGSILLPLMIFHQIQLIVCAFIAQHYAKRPMNQKSNTNS